MNSAGKLNLVSVGPGFLHLVPPLAAAALRESKVIIGYELYFTWIQPWIEGKEIYSLSLGQERQRVQKALEFARAGRIVSLISSGDVGVYGMASLALEEMREDEEFHLQVIPGISAANSSAALLGSPLSHDFATLSLSDLLCPWAWIEERARHIAAADMVVALYNVQSQSRFDGVYRILRILLENKAPSTWCGVARNAYRPNQTSYVCTLEELLGRQFDMLTTIIVGNRFTRRKGRFIYTPRGYHPWPKPCQLTSSVPDKKQTIWVFSGTGDGNALAAELSGKGYRLIVSTASDYGAELAAEALPGVVVRSGSKGIDARRSELRKSQASAIVDATHPFATEMSTQLTRLAGELNIPYIRYERPSAELTGVAHQVGDMPAAARQAIELGKRIFLATGIKDLETFLGQSSARNRHWFLRITPDLDSLERALKLGVPRSNICAMQGPFSTEINVALWSSWNVDCVVTKESGEAGGFQSKVEAARTLGIPLIVVKRPKLSYLTVASDFKTLVDLLEESLRDRGSCRDLPASTNPTSPARTRSVLNSE
ncbi:MAG TPA: precorrin-3B C(17)-methyltransferase [Chthoniobacterales bacterium]|nr:precorrin-3B C(17)-methyltransferase [Chthoniobacterales bacterium]